MTGNNPKLKFVSSNAYTKFNKILSIFSKDILSGNGNGILTSIKGQNSVMNWGKLQEKFQTRSY